MSQFPSIYQHALGDPNQISAQQQQQSFNNPFLQQNQLGGVNQNYNQPGVNWQQPRADYNQQQPIMQPWNQGTHNILANTGLPQNIIEQIRASSNGFTPIFILPNASNCNQVPDQQRQQSVVPMQPAMPCPATILYQPTCFPYPLPMCPYDSFGLRKCEPPATPPCNCSAKNSNSLTQANNFQPTNVSPTSNHEQFFDHRCTSSSDGTICSKRNCPAAIQLQAMVSQLLSIQGIVSCAITRILLKKIPGSDITSSMEDTMQQAERAIQQLSKDQLLNESRNSMQVNALISLYLSANPMPIIIPILTLVQLKNNILKALIERLINHRVMENQGCGAETPNQLDPLILGLKSDCELRELLSSLRDRECQERVNVNFAPYRAQKIVAETKLCNIQRKIEQVEKELEMRRDRLMPKSSNMSCQINSNSVCQPLQKGPNCGIFDSPDPFADIFIGSPCKSKKLLLKPHVGSQETTYCMSKKNEICPKEQQTEPEEKQCPNLPKENKKDPNEKSNECSCTTSNVSISSHSTGNQSSGTTCERKNSTSIESTMTYCSIQSKYCKDNDSKEHEIDIAESEKETDEEC